MLYVGRLIALAFGVSAPAWALTPEAQEFTPISKQFEPKLLHSPDPEDLAAISRQQREAVYRCD
ncbi:MAG TPA: hypothetical protein VE085_11160 [Burkholderiales bacterium]|nr:hypothetical protein [Burkholderiales bacterium]